MQCDWAVGHASDEADAHALRGMGQQGKLGLYNFLGFWGCGVIVGYMLCFHVGWGLKGLWSGIVAGVFLTR